MTEPIKSDKFEIECIINAAFEKHIPLIIKSCVEKDELREAHCKAADLFSKDENVALLFETPLSLKAHLLAHEKIESVGKWVFRLILTGIIGCIAYVAKVWYGKEIHP